MSETTISTSTALAPNVNTATATAKPAAKPTAKPVSKPRPSKAKTVSLMAKPTTAAKTAVVKPVVSSVKKVSVIKKAVVIKAAPVKVGAKKPVAKKAAVKIPVAKKPEIKKPDIKKLDKKTSKKAKPEKVKMERDSFTMPKDEYAQLTLLKARLNTMGQPAKKSELLRAGIKLLAAMSDNTLKTTLAKIPVIKTGRPKK